MPGMNGISPQASIASLTCSEETKSWSVMVAAPKPLARIMAILS